MFRIWKALFEIESCLIHLPFAWQQPSFLPLAAQCSWVAASSGMAHPSPTLTGFCFSFCLPWPQLNFTGISLHRSLITVSRIRQASLCGSVTFPCTYSSSAAEQCPLQRGDNTMPPLCALSPWQKNKWALRSGYAARGWHVTPKETVAGNLLVFLLKLKMSRGDSNAAVLNNCNIIT